MDCAQCVRASRSAERFVVHADEKLTAFVELEAAIRACADCARQASRFFQNSPLSNQYVRRPCECGGASVSAPLFSSRYSWVRPVLAATTPRPLEPRARDGSPSSTKTTPYSLRTGTQ